MYSINRAKLQWFSLDCRKVNWFCRVTPCDWLKTQKREKTSGNESRLVRISKPIMIRSQSFSAPLVRSLYYFDYRLVQWSVSFLIGVNDFFGFGFMMFNWKPLYVVREFFSRALKSTDLAIWNNTELIMIFLFWNNVSGTHPENESNLF